MTREEGNLVGEEVNVGDVVTVNRRLDRQYRINTGDTFTLEPGERFVVTRVYGESLNIRTIGTKTITSYRRNEQKQVSFGISRAFLMFEDPNYVPPPPPRRLGRVPTHEEAGLDESVEIIGYDHPGIQWLWNDMGQYATDQSWCTQYDALCAKLGVPGRPREFSVRTSVKGISLTTTVKARSQREANELVRTALTDPTSLSVEDVDAD